MSMECFGRFGVRTSEFLHVLYWHAAHIRGSAQADDKRRRGYIEGQLRGELSVVLAKKANAERLTSSKESHIREGLLIQCPHSLIIISDLCGSVKQLPL